MESHLGVGSDAGSAVSVDLLDDVLNVGGSSGSTMQHSSLIAQPPSSEPLCVAQGSQGCGLGTSDWAAFSGADTFHARL